MERNLLIVTPEENFYGSLAGLPPSISQNIYQVIFKESISEEALQEIRQTITQNNIKGIISRGSWAAFLENCLDIPIFPFLADAFDLLLNIDHAMKKGYHRIGLFGHLGNQKCEHNYGTISKMEFGENACYMSHVKTKEESEFILDRMTSLYQIEAAIGDIEYQETVESRGIPFFPYHLSSEFLAHTVENAEHMIEMSEQQKRHYSYVETLTNIISECSIIAGASGNILFSNHTAQSEFFLKENHITNVQSLLQAPDLLKEQSNRIVQIGKKKYIMNVLPVTLDGEQNYSILLSSTKQIESTEMSIRRQMHENHLTAKYHFEDIIYADPITSQLIRMAQRYAVSDGTVLITGKSGTGKEMYANSIHNESLRKDGPFVAINCATLTESLIESELFGYEKGAFTGALTSGKKGLFELAHNGTLFLDEIGELPVSLQAKLLRVLQEHEVRHIGGSKNIPVDVRIIAATNKNLLQMVHDGSFREDLYYRLSLLEINLPALQERPDDIIPLFKHFLVSLIKKSGRKLYWLDDDVFLPLLEYSWPGNIRELQNIAERTVLLSDSLQLTADFLAFLLPIHVRKKGTETAGIKESFSIADTRDLNELESRYISYLLKKFGGDKDKVCQYLNISRPTLWRKLTYVQNDN